MFQILLILSLMGLFLMPSISEADSTKTVKNILFLVKNGEYTKLDEALSEIESLPLEKRIAVISSLLDYYIGEHGTEILLETATKTGEKITPSLIQKKWQPVDCQVEFKTICVQNIEERNRKIEWILDAIKNGIILYGEYPSNLSEELKETIRNVTIFLTDYQKVKKDFPDDLYALRKYAWERYGYTLKIFNPWGHPLKYKKINNEKIIIDAGSKGRQDSNFSITFP